MVEGTAYKIERLNILIPSTFTSNLKNRIVRTYVIGSLARSLGIGRATNVIVYHDKDKYFDSNALGRYIVKVLKYAVTPPWLKKYVFPLSPEDRYLGVVPPLQINAHISDNGPRVWGVVDQIKDGKAQIRYRVNKKWYNFVISKSMLSDFGYPKKVYQLVPVDSSSKAVIPYYELGREKYIGYFPHYSPSNLHHAITQVRKRFGGIVIGTSRKGTFFEDTNIAHKLKTSKTVTIVFGGPNRGIFEIDGFRRRDFDYIINIMEHQETKSLRTEEAVLLTLCKLGL